MANAEPDKDESDLRSVGILAYLMAGVSSAIAAVFLLQTLTGVLLLGEAQKRGSADGESLSWILIGSGLGVIGVKIFYALLFFVMGRSIRSRSRHTFCRMAAVIGCFIIPIGTIFGVYTLRILGRDSVRTMFRKAV